MSDPPAVEAPPTARQIIALIDLVRDQLTEIRQWAEQLATQQEQGEQEP